MVTLTVVYKPPIKSISSESFKIDVIDTFSIVCELKRLIFNKHGILPIHQRLSLEGNSDNFRIPARIICNIRLNRNPLTTINISGYNQDNYKFLIDINNDNILDIKFLLGQCIKEKAEYIRIIINNKQYNDNINISSISLLNDARFWLEYPSLITGHGNIHRTLPNLLDIDPVYPTIAHTLRKLGRIQPNDPHLGTRKDIKSEYKWITFKQLNDRVTNLAAGFKSLGLKPKETRLGICSINRSEWVIADYAGHTQSFITVPLYDTLSKNAIEYIINHASVQIVICTADTIKSIIKVVNKCNTLKYIVIMDDSEEDQIFIRKNQNIGYTHTISQLENIGKKQLNKSDRLPQPDDIATICYTSGTTGNPKGVILTHRNLMSGINSWWIRAPEEYVRGNDDAVLSYLPLAHIYERQVEIFCLRAGARIGYFSGSTDTLLDDIQALQPTMFVGVPRVFQKIHDKTLTEVSKSNFIRRFLFNQAYAAKSSAIKQGLPSPSFWEQLVIKKVKAKFGGRLKACLSGSAPLGVHTANFMKTCLSDMVGEGYGLTETAATGTSTDIEDNSFGHVGTPTPTVEIKLVNVEDMNYLITDQPESRGEIWIRGTSVFRGYYKNPSKTAEVLTADGWFATGDIGKWTVTGKLKIIDRKKNIFKLSQGEYVRPEYIENVYKMSPYIANIFVYGDSNTRYLVSIVIPDWEVIVDWANNNSLSSISNDYNKLCRNSKLINLIRIDMERIAKQEELNGFEIVKRFILYPDDFSVENGLLTSTMKLKRHQAKLQFKKQIELLYQQVTKSKL